MDPNPQPKTSGTSALTTLRSTFHTSTSALKTLETYIHHLEELLLEELGREEFERRLECLFLRDQRNEESLFIPDDNLSTRKRRSSSTESGSSPKKIRSDSMVSEMGSGPGLGRSILDGGGRLHSDEPDLSPKTSRKRSVLEESQQATTTTTTNVKQMARRPIIAPRSRPRRAQSAMLPNKQPSSNFHSGIQSALLPKYSSSDYHSGSSSPLKRKSSLPPAHSVSRQSSPAASRKDSVQSEKERSKQERFGSMSTSGRNTPLPSRPTLTKHAIPKKPVSSSTQTSSPSTKLSSVSNKTSSSTSDNISPSSRQGLSLTKNSAVGSKRAVPSPDEQQQPLSLTRKPWRATKKA